MKNELIAEFLGSLFLVMAAIGSRVMLYYTMDGGAALALVGNAISVAWVLYALIEVFGPISGAHFNPVVTFVMYLEKKLAMKKMFLFFAFQILGGVLGTAVTHQMFAERFDDLLFISDNFRGGPRYFSEAVATFALVFTILTLAKRGSARIPMVVSLLVGGLILATSSTMFANPQVTIARIFTDSVSGIGPNHAIMFVLMQFAGALVAFALYKIMSKEDSQND